MSHCPSLESKLAMSPCSKGSDIPKNGQDEGMENSQNFEQVENGFDVVLSSDSGSDEEIDSLAAQGYISLAQNEDDVVNNDIEQAEQEASTESTDDSDEKPTVNPQDCEEHETVAEVSTSSAFSSTQNSQMGEDEINLIKSVMRNIQLPSSAIPEWAKKIPEDKWKQPLVSALEQRTDRNNANVDTKSNTQSPSKTM
ncbi:male-enhanced antigen 1 [Paramuricea clavata]|uniref:Male-enhanced antigen 1 n=1 Tax=Paramuricea clavata TaxID=317549 RepID=A0A6S7KLV3_PARCT|nr:male-enhanced antigen 1 [Paramuricea clavata]